MKKISTVFFGTHNFAATILQGLIDSGLFDIQLVITQPDRPVGRKQEVQKSPVKLLAEKHNLQLAQPSSLKTFDFTDFKDFMDLGVVAQYGLIIPERVLNLPKMGIINVHTSLLPRYRGASPIQTALMNGETQTGVTIMKMDAGLDTGPIILQKPLDIAENDTYTTLDKKMAKIAVLGLLEAIPDYISGALQPIPQDNSLATHTKQLTREDGRVDWQKTAQEIYNKWRGLTPWPGVWTTFKNRRVKLLKIKPVIDIKDIKDIGYWILKNDKIIIRCSQDAIEIEELQVEGKNKQTAKEFINGHPSLRGGLLPTKQSIRKHS